MRKAMPWFLCIFFFRAASAEEVIAVIDLHGGEGIDRYDVISVCNALEYHLKKNPEFAVFERSIMPPILEAQGFTQPGNCSYASCLLAVGSLLSVQKVIGGEIAIESRKRLTISLKLADIKRNAVVAAVSRSLLVTKQEFLRTNLPLILEELLMQGITKEREAAALARGRKREPLTSTSIEKKVFFWGGISALAIAGIAGGAYAGYLKYGKDENTTPEGDTRDDIPQDPDIPEAEDYIPIGDAPIRSR